MGKVPVRLKEVVYTVSPFEVTILNGLFKDFPKKVQKNLSEVCGLAHQDRPCALPEVHLLCDDSMNQLLPGLEFADDCLRCPLQKGWDIALWCVAPTAATVW